MAVRSSDDNLLDLFDQAFFAGHEAVGQKEVMQVGWVYRHPVDHEALRRFHRNLGCGLLGRRIERSPLPFGRHRWVSDRGPTDLEVADRPRPRTMSREARPEMRIASRLASTRSASRRSGPAKSRNDSRSARLSSSIRSTVTSFARGGASAVPVAASA